MKLFDTSVLIKMLKEKHFEPGAISVITLIEVLRGIRDFNKRQTIKTLLEQAFTIINLDNNVIKTYCELYNLLKKSGELIEDADLLVAACAKAYSLELITSDEDFERLKKYGVKVKIERTSRRQPHK